MSMRLRTLVLAAIVGLAATACTDTRITPPAEKSIPAPAIQNTTPTTGSGLNDKIHGIIFSIFPAPLRGQIASRWDAITSLLAQAAAATDDETARLLRRQARNRFNSLVQFIQSNSGQIIASLGDTQAREAAELIVYMGTYVYDGPDGTPPKLAPGGDVAIGIVFPNLPATLQTPSKHAAIDFQAGSVLTPTVVVISQEGFFFPDNCSGPLDTRLCQYPQFYHFNAFPDVRLQIAARIGVCHVNAGDLRYPLENHDNFRLAHDRPANPANFTPGSTIVDGIEILPLISVADIMDCHTGDGYSDPFAPPSPNRGALGSLFDRGRQTLYHLASAVGRFVSPRDAFAIDLGGGADGIILSNFAVVDPLGRPDLRIQNGYPYNESRFSIQPSANESGFVPGEVVTINPWNVYNNGTATGGGSTLYLATDPGLTANVVQLATATGPTTVVPRATGFYPSQQVTLPSDLAAGTYYIGVKADVPSLVTGSIETGNVASVRITVYVPIP